MEPTSGAKPRQAGRQDIPSPPVDPVVLKIFAMVEKQLQRRKNRARRKQTVKMVGESAR